MIRRAGIVPATPESLFGTDVARALMDLASTLIHAATHAVAPEKFTELFERLGKVEGAAGTLRGALFEFVVADVVRKTTPNVDITMNKIYREGGKDVAEVDVRAIVKDREIRFIECKGLLPGNLLSDKDVDDWLTKRIPLVRKYTLQNAEYHRYKLKFELWLTGKLSPEAEMKILMAQQTIGPQKYTIEVFYADELEKTVRETNDSSLLKVVSQHFLKHPLAFLDDAVNQLIKRQILKNPFGFDGIPEEMGSASGLLGQSLPALPSE